MNVTKYIKTLLSYEVYAFSIEELYDNIPKSKTAIKSEVSRLVSAKEIQNLRKGFYIIMTPRYSNIQKLPIELYCDKLFQYLNRKYYVALFSASKLHGASHQKIQKDYVMIEKPKLKDISKGNFHINFYTVSNFPQNNLISKKSDAGIFKVSSPALTIADLIHYQTKLGGINRILSSIFELAEYLEISDLITLLEWYPNLSTIQRLGFLLEFMNAKEEHLDSILTCLGKNSYYPVLLSPQSHAKPGAVSNRWKVDVNVEIDNDI